ncbi:MAG: efflux RND transporter periplasmic adaptor subunit, partial [Pseudomonadales bacterium]
AIDGELLWLITEGSVLTQGAVVAKVDDERLRLQRIEQKLLVARAEVNLAYLNGEVDRLSRLEASRLASQTQLAEIASRRDLAVNDLAVAEARLSQLDHAIERTNIVSPVDAIVVERLREGGEFSRQGEAIVRLVNPHALEILIRFPVAYVGRIGADQAVTVSVNDVEFETTIDALIHAGDPDSQTFAGISRVPVGLSRRMVSGQFAQVRVPITMDRRSLFVPRDAVVLRGDGNYVYRIDDNNVAQRIGVTLGVGQGDLISVTGELRAGDHVAVRGVERLADGQVVTPTNS